MPSVRIETFVVHGFIGDVRQGGACNCDTVSLIPHGNGTHTECVGHISREPVYIKDVVREVMTYAKVVSISPQQSMTGGDMVIPLEEMRRALHDFTGDALIVRTLPNHSDKQCRSWSGTNPPYFEQGTGVVLREHGIKHLLCDVPSVDRESDGGVMAVHHEFWHYPESPRLDATISEMVFIGDHIEDGDYLLHLAPLALESDAAPSTITLYRFEDAA